MYRCPVFFTAIPVFGFDPIMHQQEEMTVNHPSAEIFNFLAGTWKQKNTNQKVEEVWTKCSESSLYSIRKTISEKGAISTRLIIVVGGMHGCYGRMRLFSDQLQSFPPNDRVETIIVETYSSKSLNLIFNGQTPNRYEVNYRLVNPTLLEIETIKGDKIEKLEFEKVEQK